MPPPVVRSGCPKILGLGVIGERYERLPRYAVTDTKPRLLAFDYDINGKGRRFVLWKVVPVSDDEHD